VKVRGIDVGARYTAYAPRLVVRDRGLSGGRPTSRESGRSGTGFEAWAALGAAAYVASTFGRPGIADPCRHHTGLRDHSSVMGGTTCISVSDRFLLLPEVVHVRPDPPIRRGLEMTARHVCGVLAVVTVLLAGCGDVGDRAPAPIDNPSFVVASFNRVDPAAIAAEAGPAVVPAELVAAWSSAEGNAEIVYRFLADGRYKSVQILNQLRPGGVFEFRIVQEGIVEIDGDRLVLRPTSALKSMTDPDEPQRSYTDQPASLDPESYTWQVSGSTLRLQGGDGLVLTFARQ
jgi:hypothetical protein